MSQGNGSFASELKQFERGIKLLEDVLPADQLGIVSADDGASDSEKEDPVKEEKKHARHVMKPELGPKPTSGSSAGERTGDRNGQGSQQHQACDSGNFHDGREQTFSKDDLQEQICEGSGSLVCLDERAQTCAECGSSVSKHPVDALGNEDGGNAPDNAIIPKSASEGTEELTSSGEDKSRQTPNSITACISSVKEDKKTEHANIKQAKPEYLELDKCDETWTTVENENITHSFAGNVPFFLNFKSFSGDGSGTPEEQAVFMKELGSFHKERNLEFKPPRFYGGGLNCLKLWRAVIKLGGYDQVTMSKLWRQVGESFNPPKTCTTVSWSFRSFYEKALLEYERHKVLTGELQIPRSYLSENQELHLPSVSGKARRDAATRSLQGWHTLHLHGNGDVGDQKTKERSPSSLLKHDKHLKNIGGFKRKTTFIEHSLKHPRYPAKAQMDAEVVDAGVPADWVKINVIRTKECFEVYALVPGLLREEVHVQSDAAGQVIISGEPEQPDNPWGVTPFKKIISLPSRIDPYQTSAVVTLHGQLVVRAPFERRAGLF